jgi:hypothetical protein
LPFRSSRLNGGELSQATTPERSGIVRGPDAALDFVEDIIIILGSFGCTLG